MSLCPQCGNALWGDYQFCPGHWDLYDENWHIANKIWCDYLHRGVPVPRLFPEPLTDDRWLCHPTWELNPADFE